MDTVYDNLKVAMYNMSEDMMRMKGDWQLCMDMYSQYTNGQMDLPSLLRALQNMQSTQSDLYNHILSYTVQGNNMQMTMSSNIISTYIVIWVGQTSRRCILLYFKAIYCFFVFPSFFFSLPNGTPGKPCQRHPSRVCVTDMKNE